MSRTSEMPNSSNKGCVSGRARQRPERLSAGVRANRLDRATIQQQQANLRDAELNLKYTDIVSPVSGTVIAREVDVGQTVAASLQRPRFS